ncbi:MAG TPA: adenylosuccinate lyase [Herpetosiphonaceae bacterium]|nr:adenylosuccinate lyase [Herpetosiphonaceae bacterium]
MDITPLDTLSPLDGRYRADVATLVPYFSESALYRARVQVEVEYLIFLSRAPSISFVEGLSPQQQGMLRALYRQWTPESAAAIAAWDRRINHDVKSVEYWLRERMSALGLDAWHEAVHWGLTSEDVNNLAYALLVREARDGVMVPALRDIEAALRALALQYAETPLLARTHGQPATPTTLGKELNVFVHRLNRAIAGVAAVTLTGKLNGATGNYAAHYAALPEVDWITFSRAFLRFLQLDVTLLSTQIEPHDTLAELLDAVRRANTILLDLDQDLWRYISDGYFVQSVDAREVGSSTMPHKVNPIAFENSEGNLLLANALLELFSRKLPVSRLQRDLSDSTVLRNIGAAFGYSLLAYRRTSKGIGKLRAAEDVLRQDVTAHPEVLAEAIQTILRREGYPESYEVLKQLTRGSTPTLADIHAFVDGLDVRSEVKEELRALRPERYTGLAAKLAQLAP